MYVELLDYMGSDEDIVNAAKVSTGTQLKLGESPERLIRYLMRHRHTSPFEMVEIKWRIKCPIFVARQMLRHRTASVNEISGRYSELPDEMYMPSRDRLRAQDPYNKQQSSEQGLDCTSAAQILDTLDASFAGARYDYEDFMSKGLSRETARIVLPAAQYTEFIFKIDLHNLFHFLKLRLGKDAQSEIQSIAQQMLDQVTPIAPLAVQAWKDYALDSVTFTKTELQAILAHVDKSKVLSDLANVLTSSELRDLERKLIQ